MTYKVSRITWPEGKKPNEKITKWLCQLLEDYEITGPYALTPGDAAGKNRIAAYPVGGRIRSIFPRKENGLPKFVGAGPEGIVLKYDGKHGKPGYEIVLFYNPIE